MYPFLNIGAVKISTYNLCAVLAGLLGVALSVWSLRRQFGKRRLTVWLPLTLVVAALVGARLLNVMLNPQAYSDLASVFELQYKKMSLMGGLVLGVAVIIVTAWMTKTDLGTLGDCFVPSVFAGIVLLKTGCFLNGCCFGKPAEPPFGVVFPANAAKYAFIKWLPLVKPTPQTVYPTQLYEIIGAIVALAVALLVRKCSKNRSGVFTAAFGAAFSLARLIVMPFRLWAYSDFVVQYAYPAFYVLLIALGIGYIILRNRSRAEKIV